MWRVANGLDLRLFQFSFDTMMMMILAFQNFFLITTNIHVTHALATGIGWKNTRYTGLWTLALVTIKSMITIAKCLAKNESKKTLRAKEVRVVKNLEKDPIVLVWNFFHKYKVVSLTICQHIVFCFISTNEDIILYVQIAYTIMSLNFPTANQDQ